MSTSFRFRCNGQDLEVSDLSSNTTLLDLLRARGLTGTKQGCDEGDCGACTVALLDTDAHGKKTWRAVNSCIALAPSIAGRELVTVEGVGSREQLHPVQQAMVDQYGSQCGFCTPGFVVSMFEGFHREGFGEPWQIADQLSGNLCRCTGYRPIRDAMAQALAERPNCRGDHHHRALEGEPAALPPLAYEVKDQRFFRPTTIDELLALLERFPRASLVAGATEIGVDVTKKQLRYPLLVSTEGVEALRQVEWTKDALRIGGAATITQLEEALGDELPELAKMIWVFASRQIRNRATIAGNLVTASPIGDLAPVLLALDARLELVSAKGRRTLPLSEFFLAYRKTALAPNELVEAIVVPRRAPGLRTLAASYKVSKRRELDISIVAAGFCLELDEQNVIRAARLGLGGVAATPSRARKTEAVLVGRRWDAQTLALAQETIASEFTPIDDVRSDKDYRRGLLATLLEKFFLSEESLAIDAKPGFDPGAPAFEAPPSKGLRHESAVGHVTGSAQYVDDTAARRPMLELWPVCAPHAAAKILRRDATDARAMPGVHAVLFAEDVPGENDVGAIRKDEPLFARDEISFHGQIVAVVVADTYARARAAAAQVHVEYQPLPAILSIDQAIAQGAFHTEPHTIRRGEPEAAIASATRSLEGTFRLGGQEHFYLETHAAFAEVGEAGEVTVVSSTQHPSEVQAVVSHVLHLPRSQVVVQSPRMGGGFGGKETQGNTWAALVALAAVKTGRPVRVMLDRDLDLQLTGKRHPFQAAFRVGFEPDGRVTGVTCELVSDGGWALDLSESILDRALFHFDNGYYLPAVQVRGRVAKTNTVSNTAFRGFGGPQGMLVIEELLDRVARALGLPPEVVREKNLYRGAGETNTTHYGQAIGDERLQAIWAEVKRSSELERRRAEVSCFNAEHPHVKRGLAITPMKFGISFTASFLNQAGALVHLYRDGSVQVNHGGTEMGQGLYTKLEGVAMRELGVSSVRVMKTSTDKVPNTSATAASSGSDLNGAAVRNACATLRERLSPIARELLASKYGPREGALVFEADAVFHAGAKASERVSFAEVVEKAYLAQVSLSATGYYRTPDIAYDKARGRGKPFHYFASGAAVSEVEVDGLTGMKRVLRVDLLEDVGDSLNPGVDRGQIEGAFLQGMGWLTSEELKWDAKGRLLTHSASTYQVPAISDAPIDFRVALLQNAAQPGVVHGSKAVGEPPLMLAISVREAIRDAIAAFGAPGGQVELSSPATHEAIFRAVQARLGRAAATGASEAAA